MATSVLIQNYALSLILSNANVTCDALKLDWPEPISTNQITYLQIEAQPDGISARVKFSNRYEFILNKSKLQTFRDLDYWEASKTKKSKNPLGLLWCRHKKSLVQWVLHCFVPGIASLKPIF